MIRVTHPFDQELGLTTMLATVEDAFYFIFGVIIDGDSRRGWCWSIAMFNVSGVLVWSQEGDMEDRVNFEGVRQGQFESNMGNLLDDHVWAGKLML
jgi:hypothetical protein